MGVREYDFTSTIETPTLPSATTPSVSTDLTTKSYVDTISAIMQVTGSRGTPQSITAAGGIAFTNTYYHNMWFVKGSGDVAINITANPQIAAGSIVGQQLIIIGRHDTGTLQLDDGTGLSLNGPWIGGADDVIHLIWDGTNWTEVARR